jgi:hypothetical protein
LTKKNNKNTSTSKKKNIVYHKEKKGHMYSEKLLSGDFTLQAEEKYN